MCPCAWPAASAVPKSMRGSPSCSHGSACPTTRASIRPSSPADRNSASASLAPGLPAEHPALRRGHQRPRSADHRLGPATAGGNQSRAEADHRPHHPRDGRDPSCLRPGRGHGRRAIVEQGDVADVFLHPQHPTTRRFVFEAERVDEDERHDDFAHVPGLILAPDLPRRSHLCAAAGHRGAADRGRLQHPSGRIDRIKDTPYGQLTLALVGGDLEAP